MPHYGNPTRGWIYESTVYRDPAYGWKNLRDLQPPFSSSSDRGSARRISAHGSNLTTQPSKDVSALSDFRLENRKAAVRLSAPSCKLYTSQGYISMRTYDKGGKIYKVFIIKKGEQIC